MVGKWRPYHLEEEQTYTCITLAFLWNAMSIMSWIWTSIIAYALWYTVIKEGEDIKNKFLWMIIVSIIFPILISVIPLIFN